MIDPVLLSGLSGQIKSANIAPSGNENASAADFSALLASVSRSAASDLSSAENLSVQALQGGADARTVVDAVMSAERSLQTAIAIRDKIVTAYLEVSRMSI